MTEQDSSKPTSTSGNSNATKAIDPQSLPGLLSAVLRHPDLPTDIHNDITEGLCDLSDKAGDITSPEFISRALSHNQKRPTDEPPARTPGTVLEHIQSLIEKPFQYKPITEERAIELADKILSYDDDEQAHQFIELLHGIAAAYFSKDKRKTLDVESLIMVAARHAYTRTVHFGEMFREFSELDPNVPHDLRVLTREFGEVEGE